MRDIRRSYRGLFGTLAVLAAWTLSAGVDGARAEIRLAPGQPLDRPAAAELLEPALATAAGAEAVRMRVTQPLLPLANPYRRPATLRVLDAHVSPGDAFSARLAIAVEGQPPLTLVLKGEVDRLVPVPVPMVTISAGTRLEPAAFKTLWLPPSRIREAWFHDPGELQGLEAHRALIAGQPVAVDAVGTPRLVRRGDGVVLVFETAGLRLEATGVARADGAMGERVEVRNDRSGTSVSGRVVGPGRVQVEAP